MIKINKRWVKERLRKVMKPLKMRKRWTKGLKLIKNVFKVHLHEILDAEWALKFDYLGKIDFIYIRRHL